MGLIADIHNDLEKGALRLITEYRTRLFAEAVRLCDNVEDAEDLVDRTLAKAIGKIDLYKEDDNLYGWMKTIMDNLRRNDLARPVARGTVPVDETTLEQYAGADDSTMERLMRNSDHDALREAINELDSEYRQSVAMYYFNELTLKEIASFLDSSTSSVSRKLQIARKILAAKLSVRLGKKPVAVILAFLLAGVTAFGAWKAAEALGWMDVVEPPPSETTSAPDQESFKTEKESAMNMKSVKSAVLSTMSAVAVATASADYTYYVRQDGGSDSNNGTTYATAFKTFAKARTVAFNVSAAEPGKSSVKTIYIYPGEYHIAPLDADGKPKGEDAVVGAGRKNFRLIGVDDDGTGDVRTDADPRKVVLDGDNVMRLFTSYNSGGTHLRNLTFQNGTPCSGATGATTDGGGLVRICSSGNVVSNCIFRHGVARAGGAICSTGSIGDCPIVDCKFYDCSATNGSAGAVFVNSNVDNQKYVRCDFIRCSATDGKEDSGEKILGGALSCSTKMDNTNGFYLVSCNFVSNSCTGGGGALSGPVLSATNCTFVGNVANCDGSVSYTIVGGTYMRNRTNNYVDCTFVGNVAKAMHGAETIGVAAHVGGLLVSYNDYATTFRKCVIADNVSYGFCGVLGRCDSYGQHVCMYDSVITNNLIKGDVLEPITEASSKNLKLYNYSGVVRGLNGCVVSNCVFWGNASYGAGYVLTLGSDCKVYDSIFTGNIGMECGGVTETSWGGVITMTKRCLVRNCLVCRNWRQAKNGNGATIFAEEDDCQRIENCTICDNTENADPGAHAVGPRLRGAGCAIVNSVCIGNKTEDGREVNLCLEQSAAESNCYSTVETSVDFLDPKFRNRDVSDYRLKRVSPLKDAGLLLDWMREGVKDLASQGRVNGEFPDIGCYEYWWYPTGLMLILR